MTTTRRYESPARAAKAEATRQAILAAFRDQLLEPGRDTLSPTDAAKAAGCSVRTVHGYFPTKESRLAALVELLEAEIYDQPLQLPTTPAELPDHFRRVHEVALGSPLTAALVRHGGPEWQEVRMQRRSARLDAVRAAVESIDAPADVTARAMAALFAWAGAEISLAMRDQLGIDPDEIPDSIAYAVEVIVADLQHRAATSERRR